MASALRAAVGYVVIVFAAGAVLGTLRTYLISPMVGEAWAVALELPVMLAIAWSASRTVIDRSAMPRRNGPAVVMGVAALAMLLLAETGLSLLLGRTLSQHLELYAALPARLGLLGQVVYAVFPLIQVQLTHSRRR